MGEVGPMIEINRILCPTDFSEFSSRALDHALVLARWYHSEISVVHVLPQVLMHPEYFPYLQEPILPDPGVRKQAMEELERFVSRTHDSGVTAEICLKEGEAVESILALTAEPAVDLLVMGTHGRRGFERLVLGSVAEKVLRQATCPVLTISRLREGEHPASENGNVSFKRILCPVDFSPSCLKAVEYGLSLTGEAEGKLILLHVIESHREEKGRRMKKKSSAVRSEKEQEALKRLREIISEEVRNQYPVEEIVAFGRRPYSRILELAEDNQADLIVMGVQGRSTMDLMLFGSTTNQVVRRARCPVLTIRST